MNFFDYFVIATYLIGIVIVGCWSGLRHKNRTQTSEASEFFLAGNTLRWPMIGMALFATNISCVHLVSLAQAGYDDGLLQGNFEWMAVFTLILLALFFVPFYIRSGITTLPDFLERRYNRGCRDWLAVQTIIAAVIVHIGFGFVTGGLVFNALFGVGFMTSIIFIAALVTIYSIVGGLVAVVVTESIQTFVLVGGAVVITIAAWLKIGGWGPMVEVLQQKDAFGHDDLIKLTMLRPAGDPSGLPWYSIWLGYPVLGIWYWCADQTIVQRVLGAKDENHARVGAMFAGAIKLLPVFIFVLPGLFVFALVKSGKFDVSALEVSGVRNTRMLAADDKAKIDFDKLATAGFFDPVSATLQLDNAEASGAIDHATATRVRTNGQKLYNSKNIYTQMITQLLPPGLKGVVVAALAAALMSSVAGALNSISTLFSYDLYKRFKPSASDRELVHVGRIALAVAVVLAVALVIPLNKYDSIFAGINEVIGYLAPPITAVFLLGIFWKRASAVAAEITLWFGTVVGCATYGTIKLGAAGWIPRTFLSDIPFMMMAFYLCVLCVLVQVVCSFIFPMQHTPASEQLYWKSPLDPLRAPGWPGLGNYKFLAVLLLVVMISLYWTFH